MPVDPDKTPHGAIVTPSKAVELVTAHLESVAASHGLRVLALKGPAAHLQGVRPPKVSSDVDVLTPPRDHQAIVAALQTRGWSVTAGEDPLGVVPRHATTLIHPHWPCTVDVHHRYPGFPVGRAAEVFDALWEQRDTITLAQCPVHAPSPPAHLVVLALTALREPWEPAHQAAAERIRERWAADPQELSACVDVARHTGALAVLRPLVEEASRAAGVSFDLADIPSPDREWLLVTHRRHPGTLRLAQLVDAPWGRRWGMLRDAIMPADERAAGLDIGPDAPGSALWAARIVRLRDRLGTPLATLKEFRDLRRALRDAGT